MAVQTDGAQGREAFLRLEPSHYGQPPGGMFLMTEPEPPRVGDDTLVGPDGDLDGEDPQLAQEPRLTGAVAGLIVEQIRQAAGRLPRPDLSGAQRPELMPLPELLGELVADLRELRPRDRLAEGLRQLADAIERVKVN